METLYFSRSFTSVRRSFTSIQMCHTHTHTPAPFVARNSLAGRRHRGTRRMQCLQVCLGALRASLRREYVTAPEESSYNATNGQWCMQLKWHIPYGRCRGQQATLELSKGSFSRPQGLMTRESATRTCRNNTRRTHRHM